MPNFTFNSFVPRISKSMLITIYKNYVSYDVNSENFYRYNDLITQISWIFKGQYFFPQDYSVLENVKIKFQVLQGLYKPGKRYMPVKANKPQFL